MTVFAAVVESEGFSSSASRLGLTRSAICRRIDRLEERLGVRLLNRTTRKITPTEAGRVYYERCKDLVAAVEEAELAVSGFGAEPRGLLRVNCAVVFGMVKVIPILPQFLERYRRVTLELDLSDDPLDMSGSSYDIAMHFGELPDSSLIVTRIAYTYQVICAAPSYLTKYGRPKTPADLRHHNCLMLTGLGMTWNEWLFEGPDGPMTVRVSGNFLANSGDGNYEALLSGLGIGRVLDIRSRADVVAGRLETVLDDYRPSKPRSICVIHQNRQRVPPKVRAFIEFLRESLDDET
jgi:DNA-binding transcriptional LysR family regulator